MVIREDVALVHAAKRGDLEAFEKLVNRHTALVFRVVRHIVHCNEDAEDVVQDAFLSAFSHLQQFEERARFSTWVARIAVHAALSKVQHEQRFPAIPIQDEEDSSQSVEERVADWRLNPEQQFSNTELKAILEQALASLPERYRLIFVLRDMECLSVAETAAMVGISIANVKVRLFRARVQLRKQLSVYFDGKGNKLAPSKTARGAAAEVGVSAEILNAAEYVAGKQNRQAIRP
jgi:RNA polymerase sigma-70 factor (ECF subfamily)